MNRNISEGHLNLLAFFFSCHFLQLFLQNCKLVTDNLVSDHHQCSAPLLVLAPLPPLPQMQGFLSAAPTQVYLNSSIQ